jgi:hypothetical protein
VSSSAQAPQDLRRLLQIRRFTDNFVIERDEGIGCEHDLVWICSCDRHAFSDRVPYRELAQRKIDNELFRDARRDAFKLEPGFGKQCGSSGGAGCQHE